MVLLRTKESAMIHHYFNFTRATTFIICLALLAITITAAASLPLLATDTTNANELLVFDVNRPVTTEDRGFPRNDPPRAEANGNWLQPVNFAGGTFHFRVHVRDQPVPQAMRIQFCIWQDNFNLENCAPMADVSGAAGTVVTWEKPVQELWMKGGKIIDWSRPRQRYGFAIKNSQGQPVSDYSGWNWNGENPNHWYPLDAQLTVVVVAAGDTFSGWHNYVDGVATPTATAVAPATATPPSTPTAQPTATSTATSTPTLTATSTPEPKSTPSPSPTATPTGPQADAYEPNDSCVQAGAIATDATQQEHTLHQAADEDWMQFDGVAGVTYRIRVSTSANLVAEVVLTCEESTPLLSASTASMPEFRLDYEAEENGPVFLRIRREDARSGEVVGYGLAVREMEAEGVEIFLPMVVR